MTNSNGVNVTREEFNGLIDKVTALIIKIEHIEQIVAEGFANEIVRKLSDLEKQVVLYRQEADQITHEFTGIKPYLIGLKSALQTLGHVAEAGPFR